MRLYGMNKLCKINKLHILSHLGPRATGASTSTKRIAIMQSAIITSDPILLIGARQGSNAPQDIRDYLGRLVRSYDTGYTVVRVEPSASVARRMDGSIIPGAARLYIAREEGDDGKPVGHWTEAAYIAAPGLTVLHWDPRTDYRADPAACEALYQAATAAEEQRIEKQRKAEEERRANEARCEKMWQEFTPAWAKGYIIAEYHQDKSDPMTDYFAYRVTETVLLGFSKSDRNSFPEMRKFAAAFPETAHLALKKPIADKDVSVPRSESECRTGRATERYGVEHRENYSGGDGYYLGGACGRSSGWIIRKRSLKYGLPRGGSAVVNFSHWILNH